MACGALRRAVIAVQLLHAAATRQCVSTLSCASFNPSSTCHLLRALQFESASERQQHSHHLAGLAAVAADWATGQELPVPLLCSLTPQGNALLSLLRDSGGQAAGQQALAAAAPPLLVPVGQGQPDSMGGSDDEQWQGRAPGASGTQLLPYVRGVPHVLVAAVLDGTLE